MVDCTLHLLDKHTGDHVSAGEIMASSGPGGYCGGYEPVECETRGYSVSLSLDTGEYDTSH